jgi:predicted transcriptional regulator
MKREYNAIDKESLTSKRNGSEITQKKRRNVIDYIDDKVVAPFDLVITALSDHNR